MTEKYPSRIISVAEKDVLNQKEIELSGQIENASDVSDCKIFLWDDIENIMPKIECIDNINTNIALTGKILESAHPYSNSVNETKTYTYNGLCQSIDVTFSSDTETESGYDHIYIYDVNDNQIGITFVYQTKVILFLCANRIATRFFGLSEVFPELLFFCERGKKSAKILPDQLMLQKKIDKCTSRV